MLEEPPCYRDQVLSRVQTPELVAGCPRTAGYGVQEEAGVECSCKTLTSI